MKENKLVRKGKKITAVGGGTSITYKSINAAKRESFRLQKADGGLGSGMLRVEKLNIVKNK